MAIKGFSKVNDYITMLGTGNALATRCYNTCFTLHGENGVLLVDAGGGNGILTQLEKAGIRCEDISDIFVTLTSRSSVFLLRYQLVWQRMALVSSPSRPSTPTTS